MGSFGFDRRLLRVVGCVECSFDVVLIESSSELFTCSLNVLEVDFPVCLGFFFCYFCCSFFSSIVLFDCLHDS